MKFGNNIFLLYAVTDHVFAREECLIEQIEKALSSGVTLLQLREKHMEKKDFLEEALIVRELTNRYGVPLIINDDVDIAIQCNADGVHVGQEDMSPALVRSRIGEKGILGVTVKTVQQAQKAWEAGADYLGVGAVFPSLTKKEAVPVTMEQLSEICRSVPLPVTAIGGISCENVSSLKGTGIAGAAVVSGIFRQKDIPLAVHTLKEQLQKVVKV